MVVDVRVAWSFELVFFPPGVFGFSMVSPTVLNAFNQVRFVFILSVRFK